MNKKIGPFLFWGLSGLAALGVVRVTRHYSMWKEQQLRRLQSDSCLLETARGVVEVQIEGSGPVLLFSHGTPGGYDQVMALARFLGLSDYTVLTLSRPGYLRTPLESGRTPEEQADLYAAVLDALKLSQVVIVGHSGGGPSAIQFALRHPKRCRGLVLLSALSQPYTEEEMYRALPQGERQFKQLVDRLIGYNPFLYLLLILCRLVPEAARSQDLLRSLTMPHLRQAGCHNDLLQYAVLPAYPVQQITAPTLLIHGTADRDVPYSSATQLADALPHARLLTIERGDHVSTLAQPEKVIVPGLRAFLAELTPEVDVRQGG